MSTFSWSPEVPSEPGWYLARDISNPNFLLRVEFHSYHCDTCWTDDQDVLDDDRFGINLNPKSFGAFIPFPKSVEDIGELLKERARLLAALESMVESYDIVVHTLPSSGREGVAKRAFLHTAEPVRALIAKAKGERQ